MSAPIEKTKVGELRPSQMLFTFGVGAAVDLPNLSVMVMGIDDWETARCAAITEDRLLAVVQNKLGATVTHLRQPPLPPRTEGRFGGFDESNRIGVPVAAFPGWYVCPRCSQMAPLSGSILTLKSDAYKRPESVRYVHSNCPKAANPPSVVPARFVAACPQGHLDDFPWSDFVHRGKSDCKGRLKLKESGVSGTASDVWVNCEGCDTSRQMADAFGESGKKSMPMCRGRHPHLRRFDETRCPEQMEAILLGASNAWFPVTLSALSIPGDTSKMSQLIEKHWGELEFGADSLASLKIVLGLFRRRGEHPDLVKHSDESIWEEVERRRENRLPENKTSDLKTPEWRVFSDADVSKNTPDFRLRPVAAPVGFESLISKTVLVENLREVRALVGFTRIESPYDTNDAGEVEEERWAPVGRGEIKWVPASEIRGEGIFLQFDETALVRWEKETPDMEEYRRRFLLAHAAWRNARGLNPTANFPGMRYLMIHTFAHALMRELALECGYTAAGLRERIYSKYGHEESGPQAGVLIYTAVPDSEGTLGGLVALGEPDSLGRHIEQALDAIRLCASDPLCAEHDPTQPTATLHLAACHGCLFSPETSCERGNRYLDRTLIVPTVKFDDKSFFGRGR